MLVKTLENVEAATDPELKSLEARRLQPSGVKITWGDLVGRMVRYLEAHNYDRDETVCVRVLNVLTAHLLAHRAADDG